MIGRGVIFVRAQSPSGRCYTTDVFDLDEPSFRAYVLEMLIRAKVVTPFESDVEEEEFIYKSTKEPE